MSFSTRLSNEEKTISTVVNATKCVTIEQVEYLLNRIYLKNPSTVPNTIEILKRLKAVNILSDKYLTPFFDSRINRNGVSVMWYLIGELENMAIEGDKQETAQNRADMEDVILGLRQGTTPTTCYYSNKSGLYDILVTTATQVANNIRLIEREYIQMNKHEKQFVPTKIFLFDNEAHKEEVIKIIEDAECHYPKKIVFLDYKNDITEAPEITIYN